MKLLPNKAFPNLRNNYFLILESALIVALSAFIALFKLPLENNSAGKNWSVTNKEIVYFSSVMPLESQKYIPDPPTSVSVPIPSTADVIIEQELKNLDMDFDDSDFIELPPKKITMRREVEKSIIKKPVLVGGLTKFQKNIEYPRKALKDNIQGRVIIRFTVDQKGYVRDPEILKGVRNDIDKEALRAISKSRFKPARKNGKPITVEHLISILFQIEMRSASVGMN